jgi:uncharacterized protein HemX
MAKKPTATKPARQPTSTSSGSSNGLCMALLVLIIAICIGGSVYLYQHNEYVFDQHTLQAISKRAIAKNGNSSVSVLAASHICFYNLSSRVLCRHWSMMWLHSFVKNMATTF